MSGMKSLQYSVRTMNPVIMSQTGSDENLVASLDHIRGRAILGCLASRYIQQNSSTIALGRAHKDPLFSRLFLSNAVRFADLIPAREDAVSHSYTVFAPAPLSLQCEKHSPQLFNLLNEVPDVPTKPIHQLLAVVGETARAVSVSKQIQFHNARSVVSDARPLARRQGHTTKGGIFNYEAISPGELFWGEIWGSQEDLEILKKLIETNPHLTLGRSRTAQYGAVSVKTLGVGEAGHTTLLRRYAPLLSTCARKPTTRLDSNQAVVAFVSPSILVDRSGHSSVTAEMIQGTIVRLLGADEGSPATISVPHAFLREDIAESFVGTWRMKTPSRPAVAAGSIVLLQVGAPWTATQRALLRSLESTGIGIRTNEGYGQVVILLDDDNKVLSEDDEQPKPWSLDKYDEACHAPIQPEGTPPAALTGIAQTIWKTRIAALTEQAAILDAAGWSGHVSPSLLGKLESIVLHSASMLEVRSCLIEGDSSGNVPGRPGKTGVLRKPATDQLHHSYRDGHSMYEALAKIDMLASVYASKETTNILELLRECGIPEPSDGDSLLRMYWARTLKALRKHSRQEGK